MIVSWFDPDWNEELTIGDVYFIHFLNMSNPFYWLLTWSVFLFLFIPCIYAALVTLNVFATDFGPLEDYAGTQI